MLILQLETALKHRAEALSTVAECRKAAMGLAGNYVRSHTVRFKGNSGSPDSKGSPYMYPEMSSRWAIGFLTMR